MTLRRNLGALVIGAMALTVAWGCEKPSDSKAATDSASTATASAASDATPKAATAAASAGDNKMPELKLIVTKGQAPRLPGRSAVPTLAEWNGVGEVTVKGSSALNCETKMVREWLRVSCRGKNDSGGTPVDIMLMSGGGPGTFHFNAAGVSSLVIPYVNGTDVKAIVSWTDKSHALRLWWPHGAPKPPVLGVFKGAKSPLDRPHVKLSKPDLAFECECERTGYGGLFPQDPASKCEDTVVSNVHCLQTYRGNCSQYYKCMIGEPGVPVSCPSGYHMYIMNTCQKNCSSDAECGAGKCVDQGGAKGCSN